MTLIELYKLVCTALVSAGILGLLSILAATWLHDRGRRRRALRESAERQRANREAAIERAREEAAANDFVGRCREIIDRVGA